MAGVPAQQRERGRGRVEGKIQRWEGVAGKLKSEMESRDARCTEMKPDVEAEGKHSAPNPSAAAAASPLVR